MTNDIMTRIPQYAALTIRDNEKFLIDKIHFETCQITLQERNKVFNTVSLKSVVFDYSGWTEKEIVDFERKFCK